MGLQKKKVGQKRIKDKVAALCKDSHGSVSIYFAVVTAAIVLFHALFIDYARITAFNNQVESAARSGVRSVLSAYDEQLYERYGLFGRGGSAADDIFANVLDDNLAHEDRKAFHLLDPVREASHINTAQMVGQHPVFRRQVLEEMKYKAPIDFTIEMIDKFKPMTKGLKEANATVGLLQNLKKLYEARERNLEEALALQRQAAQALEKSGLPELVGGGNESESIRSVTELYPSYVSWVQSDRTLPEEGQPQFTAEIMQYQQRASSVISRLRQIGGQGLTEHEQMQSKAAEKLRLAREINEQMRVLADQAAEAPAHSGFDRLKDLPTDDSEQTDRSYSPSEELEDIRESAAAVVMEEGWFDAYDMGISQHLADYRTLYGRMQNFADAMAAELHAPILPSQLPVLVNQLQNVYADYRQKYSVPATVLANREGKLSSKSAVDAERKAYERRAASQLEEIQKMLRSISKTMPSEDTKQSFLQLKQRFDESIRLNEAIGETVTGEDELPPSGTPPRAGREEEGTASGIVGDDGEAQRSLDKMGGMFGGMAGLLEMMRDELYLNEYAAARFKVYDPKRLQTVFIPQDNFKAGLSFEVADQETEYIIYGFHHPTSNVAAAYAEIFAVRLAIRTMEGLVECRAMGHPLLILSAALLYGLEKTMEDMVQLVREGSTPLSKYAAGMKVTYKDYLRLFLVLHGSSEEKVARMIALIEHATGYRLFQVAAGVTGEATVSVKLWFLGGLMKRFTQAGILHGKVVGNRYETTKTVGWSYS
ncbi:hypothetical protein EBB07_01645 [Paenibacillaceae bacterium]|nr:hypothetical protein EBB07_01645 [Paenibacillaceae bacterium]